MVEGAQRLTPGQALDIGCGTGTNCIYLTQHGWAATGVDFVPRAIEMAHKKAAGAGVLPRFVVGDVTRLSKLGLGRDYDLLFDQGCFHSIPEASRDAYVRGATESARAGATMLMFCFVRSEKSSRIGPRGVTASEVRKRFTPGWEVIEELKGRPMFGSDAFWYTLRRRT